MSTLQELRQGLSEAWDSLTEGWRALRERAGQALTRFRPFSREGGLQTAGDQLIGQTVSWGLLPAEIRETPDEIRVRIEVPGMEADDFDISVIDNTLVVRGEKHIRREADEGRFQLMECAYGAFERAVPLPAEVDDSRARARYRRGVLTVTLPKSERSRMRRIEVGSD